MAAWSSLKRMILSRKLTNIPLMVGIFEDDFPFPQVGYVNFLGGMIVNYRNLDWLRWLLKQLGSHGMDSSPWNAPLFGEMFGTFPGIFPSPKTKISPSKRQRLVSQSGVTATPGEATSHMLSMIFCFSKVYPENLGFHDPIWQAYQGWFQGAARTWDPLPGKAGPILFPYHSHMCWGLNSHSNEYDTCSILFDMWCDPTTCVRGIFTVWIDLRAFDESKLPSFP